MGQSAVKRRIIIAASAVMLTGCGQVGDEAMPVLEPAHVTTTTTVLGVPIATTTTLSPGEPPPNSVDTPVVTLPDADAYPVLSVAESQREDLAPGTYWVRLPHQTDWPPQCLSEMTVFDVPEGGVATVTPVIEQNAKPREPGWERQAIALVDEMRRVRGEFCRPWDEAWEATWPDLPEPPEPDGPGAPPVTLPDR